MVLYNCSYCTKRVLSHSRVITCTACFNMIHIACSCLTYEEAVLKENWLCIHCLSQALPLVHIDDEEEYIEIISTFSTNVKYDMTHMNSLVFNPFELNDDEVLPVCDIDPDTNFFNDSIKTSCDYITPDIFYNKHVANRTQCDKNMSLFCMNIRSISKHFNELKELLHTCNMCFSFIGLTESWLNETNHDLFSMEGYQPPVQSYRSKQRGGGVMLYVKKRFNL